jgi:hypothetical protein
MGLSRNVQGVNRDFRFQLLEFKKAIQMDSAIDARIALESIPRVGQQNLM